MKNLKDLSVYSHPEGMHDLYLSRINQLLTWCLTLHPRWSIIRVDLRSPSGKHLPDRVITRFFESLKAQLNHCYAQKISMGIRAYHHMLHYIWVRERSTGLQPHYHIAILLNRDAYFTLGNYSQLYTENASPEDNLAGRIVKAWASALEVDWKTALRGVNFPTNPTYPLLSNDVDLSYQYGQVFYRLSYLAKNATKQRESGSRCFGMSQMPVHGTF